MTVQKNPNRLRRFNTFLSMLVIILAAYIIFLPLLPHLGLWWKSANPNKPPLVAANAEDGTSNGNERIPDTNTIVIPKLVMQETIHEGGVEALNKGIWHRPKTGNPQQGSNTVLVGHRFTYSDTAIFYHLDKLQVGDSIVVYWEKQKYIYEVSKTFVVSANAVEIESPTDKPILTLYTCTPIWTAKDRLVVQALIKESP